MTLPNNEPDAPPRLLVSVRDVDEALAALNGGADVIDVKEPARGSLGSAAPGVIAAVVAAVRGRVPVTAAMGEVIDWTHWTTEQVEPSVALVKFGLAGCATLVDWRERWQRALCNVRGDEVIAAPRPVAVVYADWQAAGAPAPEAVLAAGAELGCPALLVDTWDKTGGDLFCHWEAGALAKYIERVRSCGMTIVLAGSLAEESFAAAVELGPDILAVRSAACEGGRLGRVAASRVMRLKRIIEASLARPALGRNGSDSGTRLFDFGRRACDPRRDENFHDNKQ